MRLTKISYYWKKYNLTVVWDGYTDDGVRLHIVKEPLEPQWIGNTIVFNEKDLPKIEEIITKLTEG